MTGPPTPLPLLRSPLCWPHPQLHPSTPPLLFLWPDDLCPSLLPSPSSPPHRLINLHQHQRQTQPPLHLQSLRVLQPLPPVKLRHLPHLQTAVHLWTQLVYPVLVLKNLTHHKHNNLLLLYRRLQLHSPRVNLFHLHLLYSHREKEHKH